MGNEETYLITVGILFLVFLSLLFILQLHFWKNLFCCKKTYIEKRRLAQKRICAKKERKEKANYFQSKALDYFNQNEWRKAAYFFRQSINLGNDTSDNNRNEAFCIFKMEEGKTYPIFDYVERLYLRAIILDKTASINHSCIATMYVKQKKYTRALEHFKKAVELIEKVELPKLENKLEDPLLKWCKNTYKKIYLSHIIYLSEYTSDIGVCLLNISKNNKKEATEYFQKSNKIFENERALQCLAALKFDDNKYDDCLYYANKALTINPQNLQIRDLIKKAEKYKESPPVPINKKILNLLKSQFILLFLLLSIFLLIASFIDPRDLFDGYYMLLRLFTSGVCLYSAVKFKTEWAKWIFGGLAVLYNPVLPIHLGDKDAWAVINLITIIYTWAALYFENKAKKA